MMSLVAWVRPRASMRWWTAAALLVLWLGFLVLGAYVVGEMIATPGFSPVDAYWRGRLPWMGIAETLIVIGATACAVLGAATVWRLGGWLRRIVVLPLLLLVAFWWLIGIAGLPGGGPCLPSPCERPIDPWAVAYSAPESAVLFLILPGIAIALLALTAHRLPRASSSPAQDTTGRLIR